MRRLALIAATSLAFAAISEPISAFTIKKDKSGCIEKAYVGGLKRKQITAIDPDVFSDLDKDFLNSVGSKAKKNFKKKCD